MLRKAIADAGHDLALQVEVDAGFNTRLQLAPRDAHAIASELEGIRVQFDLASAPRARGLSIDWVEDARGRGLVIENPNAPTKVRDLTPAQAAERVQAGTLLLVDVRPLDERLMAEAPVPYRHLDQGVADLEALPKDTAIAFLCRSGGRSAQAAEHFRALGFTQLYNVAGGINAWALLDPNLRPY
jgi:monothiol glutaredoxin